VSGNGSRPQHGKIGPADMNEIFDRPLPAVPLPFTGERFTSAVAGKIELEHFHRYLYAREFCRGKVVLDVASGEGYGAALLAQVATSVIGIDIAREAVDHARASYRSSKLRFLEGDARKLELDSASVDVVVCFETIEHFAEHEAFLQEVRRVLRPAGIFAVSTPDRVVYSPPNSTPNPYHVRELSSDEFGGLLSRYFGDVVFLFQRQMFGSVVFPCSGTAVPPTPLCFEKMGEQQFEKSEELRAPYLLALASAETISPARPSFMIDDDQVEALLKHVAAVTQELALVRSHSELEAGALRRQLASTQEELTAARVQAASEAEALGRQLAAAEGQLASARSAAETERRGLVEQIGACEKQIAGIRDVLCGTEETLAQIYASTSWKVTQPLRLAKNFLTSKRG